MGEEAIKIVDTTEQALDMLKKIQQPIVYAEIKAPLVESSVLTRIPFLSRFVQDTAATGKAVLRLSQSVDALTPPAVLTSGLQFGVVALAGVDFLLIPIIYMSAFILKQDVPITLNNNARWSFSAILLGLTLAAVLVPAVAPIIALVASGLTLGLSVFLLGRVLHDRYELQREHKALKEDIAFAEEEIELLQAEAKALEADLLQTTDARGLDEEARRAKLYKDIAALQQNYTSYKGQLVELKSKEAELNQRGQQVGLSHILNKGLGVAFSAAAVAGLIVTLFFPPVGLAILTAVSLASLSYIVARLLIPVVRSLGKWMTSKAQEQPVLAEGDESPEKTHDKTQVNAEAFTMEKKLSTGGMLEALLPKNHGGAVVPRQQADALDDVDALPSTYRSASTTVESSLSLLGAEDGECGFESSFNEDDEEHHVAAHI